MSASVCKYDKLFVRRSLETGGRKILPGVAVHHEDVGMEDVRRVIDQDGMETYVDPRKEVIGLALFGLGRMGLIHLENVLAENLKVKLLYCVDGYEHRRNFVQYNWLLTLDVKVLGPEDEDVIFQDQRVNAVIVSSPTQTHNHLVLKALKSGKHVLCEKPLALDYNSIKECYTAASQLSLMCAFNRRFDPSFCAVRDRVQAGELGQVYTIKTCSRDSPRPSIEYIESSGGMFHDCAVHDLDLICWILGEYPIRVFAETHAFEEDIKALDDVDTVAIVLKFPSGAMGIIELSRNAPSYGYDQRLEVFGNLGVISAGDVRPLSVNVQNVTGATSTPICYSFPSRYAEAYKNELEHFINCVRGHEKVGIKGSEILAVNRLASACEESALSKKMVYLEW